MERPKKLENTQIDWLQHFQLIVAANAKSISRVFEKLSTSNGPFPEKLPEP